MNREATTFYEHVAQIGFADGAVPPADKPALKALMEALVELLQSTIGSIDFWHNPDKQKRLRGDIKTAIGKTQLAGLKAQRERVAVEVMRLARNRHDELLRAVPKDAS